MVLLLSLFTPSVVQARFYSSPIPFMAYAALLSLSYTLVQILIRDQYPHPLKKQHLVSLHRNVSTLLTFLEDYSLKCKGASGPLESRIIDAAYLAEDAIESQLSFCYPTIFKNMMLSWGQCVDLLKASQEIDFILEELGLINPSSWLHFSGSTSSSTIVTSDKNIKVGLDDDLILIKDQSSTFRVIPIVGMGCIGKNSTEVYWHSIVQEIKSIPRTVHCSEVSSLSYDHLPLYLKPCFLYVTAFPDDYEIKVDRLIRLWMAEGFVKPSGSKCLEEVAYGYLEDLVGRSLLIVSKKKYHNKIKAVKIHDNLRGIGKLKAQEDRFHYHDDDDASSLDGKQRRVTSNKSDCVHRLSKCHNPTTRSFLMLPYSKLSHHKKVSFQHLRLLRVLDTLNLSRAGSPKKLVLLRYLAITFTAPSVVKSLSKLRNLQTLIINHSGGKFEGLGVHLKIWKMPFLRHLITMGDCYFELPSDPEIVEETSLQVLSKARNLKMSLHAAKMLVNLRKLALYYEGIGEQDWKNFKLSNLVRLQKLQELKIFNCRGIRSMEVTFPHKLQKLHLSWFIGPWEDMNIVGSLPNLEKLKLTSYFSFSNSKWNPDEGQFLKLKHLELANVFLSHWGVESMHFPSLKTLVLKGMGRMLEEIPTGIGEIDTLELIELRFCTPSIVASGNKIQLQHKEMGNDNNLQVLVT